MDSDFRYVYNEFEASHSNDVAYIGRYLDAQAILCSSSITAVEFLIIST